MCRCDGWARLALQEKVRPSNLHVNPTGDVHSRHDEEGPVGDVVAYAPDSATGSRPEAAPVHWQGRRIADRFKFEGGSAGSPNDWPQRQMLIGPTKLWNPSYPKETYVR